MTAPRSTANYLKENIQRIVGLWELRVRQEVESAKIHERAVLRDEMPAFLEQLAERLSEASAMHARGEADAHLQSLRLASEHGAQRAAIGSYSLDEAIIEYHFLRLILFQVLEERIPLQTLEREIIVATVEMAVQKMACQFTKSTLEARDLFVLTLVHDLRGPLNNMNLALQFLKPENPPELQKSATEAIGSSLGRIDRMTTDLLDVRKINSGGSLPLVFEKFSLETWIRKVIEEMALGARVNVHCASSIPGYWSRDGIRRVMENLVSNAVKYGAADTPITVAIIERDTTATISVHNEGDPISSAEQAAVFDTFFSISLGPIQGMGHRPRAG